MITNILLLFITYYAIAALLGAGQLDIRYMWILNQLYKTISLSSDNQIDKSLPVCSKVLYGDERVGR